MGELTPEEKQRIYLEEKERLEAQEKIKKEQQGKTAKQSRFGCLILIAMVFFIPWLLGHFFFSKPNDVKQNKQEQLIMLQKIINSPNFKVTDCNMSDDYMSVEIEPLFEFSSRYQIEETADRLVRRMNNAFPSRSITVRLRKNLNNGMVKLYGEGYFDKWNPKVATKSY